MTILDSVLNAVRPKAEPVLPPPAQGNMVGNIMAANLAADNAARKRESDRLIADPVRFFGLLAQKCGHRDDESDLKAYLDACRAWRTACEYYVSNRTATAEAQLAAQSVAVKQAIESGRELPADPKSKEQLLEGLKSRKRGILLALQAAVDAAKEPAVRLQDVFVANGRRYHRETLTAMDRQLSDEWGLPFEPSPFLRLVDLALASMRWQLGPDQRVNGPLGNPAVWCPWVARPAAK